MSDRVKQRELPSRIDTTDGTMIFEGYVSRSTAAPQYAIKRSSLEGTTWIVKWSGGTLEKRFDWELRTSCGYEEIPLYEYNQA